MKCFAYVVLLALGFVVAGVEGGNLICVANECSCGWMAMAVKNCANSNGASVMQIECTFVE